LLSWYGVVVAGWADGAIAGMGCRCCTYTTAGRKYQVLVRGFAGSKQLMLGYAHVLAHAGYADARDFGGHGANAAQGAFSLQQTLILLMQPYVRSLKSIRRAWGGCWVISSGGDVRHP